MTDDRSQNTEMLSRLCRVFLLSFALSPLPSAYAAPPSSVHASYDILKAGLTIGQIEESFSRSGDHYTLTSTTRAVGLFALFKPGKIIIGSSGLIGAKGLQPQRFSVQEEGDEKEERRAEFDRESGKITLIHQAERKELALPEDTQDRLSAMYQFMFLPMDQLDELNFSMTNGRKLDIYHYRVTHGSSVKVPLGTFAAQYVASVPEADSSRTEIWLAIDHANFPYKMVITDKDGGQISQVLTKFELAP